MQQSSTTVMIRALVMLACLVAIPLAAMFGTSLPGMIGKLSGSRSPSDPPLADGSFSKSPTPNRPLGPSQAGMQTPRMDPGRTARPLQANTATPTTAATNAENSVRSTAFESVSAPAVHVTPPSPAHGNETTADLIERRLQQIPNVQYRIEYWGGPRPFYRFVCGVPLAGDPGLLQYFQANDVDRGRAMMDVLRQIESWRAKNR